MTASLAVQYSASSPSRQTFTSPEKIAVSVRKTDSLASNMTHSPDEAPSARARRHAFTLDRRTALAKPDACQSELWDMEMGAERARFRRGEIRHVFTGRVIAHQATSSLNGAALYSHTIRSPSASRM